MSKRIANIIVLCEDQEHQNLTMRYLGLNGHQQHDFRFILPRSGSGSQFVREDFPKQVAGCRGIIGRKTKCVLIVMTDADNLTVQAREQTLHRQLQLANRPAVVSGEPIHILVPKWQVETWIKCLLGQPMDEEDKDSDQPGVNASQIKLAAETLYGWTRDKAQVGKTCVPSLIRALPRWREIPEV